MNHTTLGFQDVLPLTCSRRGSCCFGKNVRINPWELATLANTKGISVSEFIENYCECGGTKLIFNGSSSDRGEKACSQYIDNFGCSLHTGRPLVCRLYPIGRHLQNNQVNYIFEGREFPCLRDCAEVTELPLMTIGEYLDGQQTELFENAQDLYLELLQEIADIAFTLLLETGLSEKDRLDTLNLWTNLKELKAEELSLRLNKDWTALLIQPLIRYSSNPEDFIRLHTTYIQEQVQQLLNMETSISFAQVSIQAYASALLLAYSLGVDYQSLGDHWISIARQA